MKKRTIEKSVMVPSWAVCYLAYGDSTGLDESDIEIASEWWDRQLAEGYCGIEFPADGNTELFSPYPAFGLACDTVEAIVY